MKSPRSHPNRLKTRPLRGLGSRKHSRALSDDLNITPELKNEKKWGEPWWILKIPRISETFLYWMPPRLEDTFEMTWLNCSVHNLSSRGIAFRYGRLEWLGAQENNNVRHPKHIRQHYRNLIILSRISEWMTQWIFLTVHFITRHWTVRVCF